MSYSYAIFDTQAQRKKPEYVTKKISYSTTLDHLKTILIKNNYPLNFIDLCIKSFLSKLYTPKVVAPNVPKRNVLLSYRSWKVLRFKFERSFKNYLVIN